MLLITFKLIMKFLKKISKDTGRSLAVSEEKIIIMEELIK